MRIRYGVLFVVGAVGMGASVGCSGGTDGPVATDVQITPGPGISFAALNTTQALTARVLDQNGDSMPGQTFTWSSNNDAVATVSPTGIVTAHANGTAQITATAGDIDGSVTATVAQVPATILLVGGNGQTAAVTAALPNSIRVRVRDAGTNPIPG